MNEVKIETYEYVKNKISSQHHYLIELYWIDKSEGILGVRDAKKEYVGKWSKKNKIKCILTAESGAGFHIYNEQKVVLLGLANEFLAEGKQIVGMVWKIKEEIKEFSFEWDKSLKCFAKIKIKRLADLNFNGKFYGRTGKWAIYVNNQKISITETEKNEYLTSKR